MIHLIASVTPNYLRRAQPFFESLPLIRSAKVHVILLDFNERTDPNGEKEGLLREVHRRVDFRRMELPPTHSHFMIQDSFISAFPEFGDNEVVALCDTDGVFQRDFSDDEIRWMEGVDPNAVAAYWNSGFTDNLALEAGRISLNYSWIDKHAPSHLEKLGCYNCGFQVAQVGVFRRIQWEFASLHASFFAAAPHRSRCQFLLNLCWRRLGLDIELLPHTIHQHSHWMDTEGNVLLAAPEPEIIWKTVCVEGGVPVVFRHHFQFDVPKGV